MTEPATDRPARAFVRALAGAALTRLGDVPALIARLQADAMTLRARGEDAAVPVAAIEAMRLDLLRLHVGAGSIHELTRDVEAAREIGRRVDAALGKRDEIAPSR